MYWEMWAKDVAEIATSHMKKIRKLIDTEDPEIKKAIDEFLLGLRKNLNNSITQEDAIEMLAQHMITKPVFNALFEDYEFVNNNPVSKTMQKMIDILDKQVPEEEKEKLNNFYESVKDRANGIDNAAGKQKIILELYEKFFKTALPKEPVPPVIIRVFPEKTDMVGNLQNYIS
jgi:predicted helicase